MTCFKGRDEMKKAMLSELASILTIGEYRKLTQVFADMPDYEFDQIVAECVEMVKREGVSYKDLVKKRFEFNKNRNVTFEISALNCVAMEPLRDEASFPQRGVEQRAFQVSAVTTLARSPAEKPLASRLATFTVNVLFRQNASWQGSIVWNERKLESHFRSALVLITLMDDALCAAQEG